MQTYLISYRVQMKIMDTVMTCTRYFKIDKNISTKFVPP